MKLEDAQELAETLDSKGIEARLDEDYSGRGMFGKTTAAVVIRDHHDLPKTLMLMGKLGFAEPRTDDMGKGVVLY